MAEIAQELHSSRSTIYEHTAELRKKGLLSGSTHSARSLKPTSKATKLLKIKSESTEKTDSLELSVAGTVAAGQPIEAIYDTETISVEQCLRAGEESFLLHVQGDSMIEEGICEGDYIVCKRAEIAANGQLVVAILDDENVTLKRFFKDKNHIRLEPANSNYSPIISRNCRVHAVVTGLIRSY
jgi:repressor LexA